MFQRPLRVDFSDKVNIKVRSEDSKGVNQRNSCGRAFPGSWEGREVCLLYRRKSKEVTVAGARRGREGEAER